MQQCSELGGEAGRGEDSYQNASLPKSDYDYGGSVEEYVVLRCTVTNSGPYLWGGRES